MVARKTNTYKGITSYKYLCIALAQEKYTQYELSDITGLNRSTISRWIKLLYRKPGMIYICSWKRVGERGNWSRVWGLGINKFDAPKPKAMSYAEYARRWRKKKLYSSKTVKTSLGVIHVAA